MDRTGVGGVARGVRPVGRDDEITALRLAIRDHQLVTVLGTGGAGKSTLARHVVATEDGDRDVLHVDLAGLPDGVAVADAVGTAAGIDTSSADDLVGTVTAALRHRRVLLLIDDGEVAIESVRDLVTALGRSSATRVVVTSRVPLDLTDEHRFPLRPLSVPDPGTDDLAAVLANDAVTMLVDRIRAHDPAVEFHDRDAPLLVDLVRRLDGLPLAIELAAARVGTLGLFDVHARLEERFALLTRGHRDLAPRQRSLEATVAWSHDQLEPDARTLFARLAVFPAGAQLDMVEAVCSGDGIDRTDVVDLLDDLVAASLVVVDRGRARPRFRLLETLRVFGRQRLQERGELDRWQERLADGVVGFAEQAGRALATGEDRPWWHRVAAETEALRAVHAWALANDRHDVAVRIVGSLWLYGIWRDPEFGRRAVQLALTADPTTPGFVRLAGLAVVMLGRLGDVESAIVVQARARPLLGDDPEDAVALRIATAAHQMFSGRLGALDADELLGPPAAGSVLTDVVRANIALVAAYRGDVTTADALMRTAPDDLDGLPAAVALMLGFARAELLAERDPPAAAAWYDRTLTLADDVGAVHMMVNAGTGRCAALGRVGRPDEVLAAYGTTVDQLAAIGSWHTVVVLVRNLVEFLARIDLPEAAARLDLHVRAVRDAPVEAGAQAERLETLRDRIAADVDAERLAVMRDEVPDDPDVTTLGPAVSRVLAAVTRRLASSPTDVEATFLFTDIVGSTELLGVIGDRAWSALKSWHDETLRAAFAAHGGDEQDDAGDGFFVAFASAERAVTCALDVQRRLEDHRATAGFAPTVRIGVHTATAVHDGGYRGAAVHVAARIAALADGGEVLVSAATAASAGVLGGERLEASLKGVVEPVTLVRLPREDPAAT